MICGHAETKELRLPSLWSTWAGQGPGQGQLIDVTGLEATCEPSRLGRAWHAPAPSHVRLDYLYMSSALAARPGSSAPGVTPYEASSRRHRILMCFTSPRRLSPHHGRQRIAAYGKTLLADPSIPASSPSPPLPCLPHRTPALFSRKKGYCTAYSAVCRGWRAKHEALERSSLLPSHHRLVRNAQSPVCCLIHLVSLDSLMRMGCIESDKLQQSHQVLAPLFQGTPVMASCRRIIMFA